MPPINYLIKPVSSNCNLTCKYCFYHSIAENREVASYGIMNEDTLEEIVRRGLEYADVMCGFAFQGGEPTLAGLNFFGKVIELQQKYNKKNLNIINSIQTNGMLIDEKWAEFLYNNNFLVGLSLDGPKEVHNLNRVDSKSNGTFNQVMKTIELFNKYKVEYNILCVVTNNSARFANRIYSFFKENGFKYIQYISCLDPLNEVPGKHTYSLKPRDLEKFLKITFDRWYEDCMNGEFISIRYFDNFIAMLLGQGPEACNMTGQCTINCIIESDGGVYPCDFYVIDKWHLGNIKEKKIEDMVSSDVAKEFIQQSLYLPLECKDCKWYGLCRGGCRRERESIENVKVGLNYYCSAYKGFFDYAYDGLVTVARMLSRR